MGEAPIGDSLNKRDWEVGEVDRAIAKKLIEQWHYSQSSGEIISAAFGLFRVDNPERCWGVTTWTPAMITPAIRRLVPDQNEWDHIVGLSRLVIDPTAPKNAATFLLTKSVQLLDQWWKLCVTYADLWQGHAGTIYKAAGWLYDGMSKAQPVYKLADGSMVSHRRGDVTLTHKEMLEIGAEYLGEWEKHRYVYWREGGQALQRVRKARKKIDVFAKVVRESD